MNRISSAQDFSWELGRLAWGNPRGGHVFGWRRIVGRLWWRV